MGFTNQFELAQYHSLGELQIKDGCLAGSDRDASLGRLLLGNLRKLPELLPGTGDQ